MPSKFRLLDLWRSFAQSALRLDNRGRERMEDEDNSCPSFVDSHNGKAFLHPVSTLDKSLHLPCRKVMIAA